MMKESEVIFKRHNESSSCLLFLVSLMILCLVLFTVLPPVMNRNNFPAHAKNTEVWSNQMTTEQPNTADATLVQTQFGAVQGVLENSVRAFHGVPYANPPTGQLRWRGPMPLTPWSPGVYNATWSRPGCPQHDCQLSQFCPKKTSEDCLYLEIYTPIMSEPSGKLLPVNVYLHGGGFSHGAITAPGYNPTYFVRRAGVLFVLVAYRLGSLGFLVTGKGQGHASGNYGLLDQIEALKWVKNNIESFGGDPHRVTLTGQSAGAQSALLHMTSEASSGYFRQAIVESPPISYRFKTVPEATEMGISLALKLNCTRGKRNVDMECMRNAELEQILRAQKAMDSKLDFVKRLEPWAPVLDGDLVKDQLADALQRYSQSGSKVMPSIWGTTSQEAALFVYLGMTLTLPSALYPTVLSAIFDDAATELIRLYPARDGSDIRKGLTDIATDFFFRCPVRSLTKSFASKGDHHLWLYSWERYMHGVNISELLPACSERVCHGTEILYTFKSFSFADLSVSPEDLKLSGNIIDYYANFMKYGNPNGGPTKRPRTTLPLWHAAGSGAVRRLKFTKDAKIEEDSNESKGCDFFDKRGYVLHTGSFL